MAVVGIKKSTFEEIIIKVSGSLSELPLPYPLYKKENLQVFLNGNNLIEGENKDYIYDFINNKIIFTPALQDNDVIKLLILQ